MTKASKTPPSSTGSSTRNVILPQSVVERTITEQPGLTKVDAVPCEVTAMNKDATLQDATLQDAHDDTPRFHDEFTPQDTALDEMPHVEALLTLSTSEETTQGEVAESERCCDSLRGSQQMCTTDTQASQVCGWVQLTKTRWIKASDAEDTQIAGDPASASTDETLGEHERVQKESTRRTASMRPDAAWISADSSRDEPCCYVEVACAAVDELRDSAASALDVERIGESAQAAEEPFVHVDESESSKQLGVGRVEGAIVNANVVSQQGCAALDELPRPSCEEAMLAEATNSENLGATDSQLSQSSGWVQITKTRWINAALGEDVHISDDSAAVIEATSTHDDVAEPMVVQKERKIRIASVRSDDAWISADTSRDEAHPFVAVQRAGEITSESAQSAQDKVAGPAESTIHMQRRKRVVQAHDPSALGRPSRSVLFATQAWAQSVDTTDADETSSVASDTTVSTVHSNDRQDYVDFIQYKASRDDQLLADCVEEQAPAVVDSFEIGTVVDDADLNLRHDAEDLESDTFLEFAEGPLVNQCDVASGLESNWHEENACFEFEAFENQVLDENEARVRRRKYSDVLLLSTEPDCHFIGDWSASQAVADNLSTADDVNEKGMSPKATTSRTLLRKMSSLKRLAA